MTVPLNPAAPIKRGTVAGNDTPPVAVTTEGASNALEAIAGEPYYSEQAAGKRLSPRNRPVNLGRRAHARNDRIEFEGSNGQLWTYSGKRARVLEMLATTPGGVTQWDCYPWHTRLGASVHALRCDGLEIETEREGEYRHARYRLRTGGSLLIQGENNGEPVNIHRAAP